MGNVNCVASRRSSTSISIEDVYLENIRVNKKSTGETSDCREVVSRNIVNNFVQPSYEALSSSTDVSSNSQMLESRYPSIVPSGATNAIQQENTQNLSLYSKLVAKLPDNPDFYPEKFIENEACDPKQYLKDNEEQLIKVFTDAISKDPYLSLSSVSIKEQLTDNPVLVFKGSFIEHCQNPIKDVEAVESSKKQYHSFTQETSLSEVINKSKNLAEFITNMRLAATFAGLTAKINAPAHGFEIKMLPFTGLWKEDEYSHLERSLEEHFAEDMEFFLVDGIISLVQDAVSTEMDKWEDVPESFGCYFSNENSVNVVFI
jgi:hypothetical protein